MSRRGKKNTHTHTGSEEEEGVVHVRPCSGVYSHQHAEMLRCAAAAAAVSSCYRLFISLARTCLTVARVHARGKNLLKKKRFKSDSGLWWQRRHLCLCCYNCHVSICVTTLVHVYVCVDTSKRVTVLVKRVYWLGCASQTWGKKIWLPGD